jgi:hypothetical protein
MHDISLIMHNHLLSSLLTLATKTKNSNKYIVPKFNANIRSKWTLKWFEYVYIKNLDNSGVGKIKGPSHNTPQTIPFLMN